MDSVIRIKVEVMVDIDCKLCRLKELGLFPWKFYVIIHTTGV